MDGLLPVGFDVGSVTSPSEKVQQLTINEITPNPKQPRKTFDKQSLQELSDSIKEHGVIQPLIVTKLDEGYQIIAGERRWRASKIAGLNKVPVIIRNTEEQQKLEIAIIENVQRVDLSPLEEATSMYRLKHEFGLDLKEISKKLSKASTTVSNTMRLLQLPEEAKKALMNNDITEGHARAILSLTDEKQQQNLLNKIIAQKLSVRLAELEAKNMKSHAIDKIPKKQPSIIVSKNTLSNLKNIPKVISSGVAFNSGKSTLEFKIDSEEQILAILKRLL